MRKFIANFMKGVYETQRIATLASGSRRERREASRIRKGAPARKTADA